MKNLIIPMLIALLPVSSIVAQQQIKQQEERTIDTEEVLEIYKKAFLKKDLEELMDLYSEDAVFIGPEGVVEKGAKTIRKSLNAAFSNFFPAGMEQESWFQRIEGPVAYQVYSLTDTQAGEKLLPFVTDTFVIRDGKIIYHTMAAHIPGMEIVDSPYALPVPEGWPAVITISLPRYFAPELYEGVADYYFMPGMFSADAEDYFTYAMVLWIENDHLHEKERLEKDLEIYFDGLTLGNKLDIDKDNIQNEINIQFDSLSKVHSLPVEELRSRVDLKVVDGSKKWDKSYKGVIQTYDALVAYSQLKLYTDLHLKKCGQYTVMFLKASPHPPSHQVWEELNALQGKFECPPPK